MNEASWLREALGLKHGNTPFPWQEELLKQFQAGDIPASLDIPTGLGKTSVMAIWLVARACGAILPPRLVYVVDRRAVVDQATTEAERLRIWLENDTDVRRNLGLTRPLPISTLRGQYVDNREWQEDPASPAIVVGTVDMVGSRLLFEGYGVSRKMRPYHAGLLGAGTLVILDEAHLVPPFEKLLSNIAKGDTEFGARGQGGSDVIPPFKLMSLSATGRTEADSCFRLTNGDFTHPIAKKRLEAKKRVVFNRLNSGGETEAEPDDLAEKLAEEAWRLAGNGSLAERVIIFCDSRKIATDAKSAIDKYAKNTGIDVELFVGGRRVFERQVAHVRLQHMGFIAGSECSPRETCIFVCNLRR